MPYAPPRRCARCNQACPAGQPCPCRPAYEGSRHPAGHKRWTRLRAAQLRAYPICNHPDCRHIATEVDHIIPLAEGANRYDRSNLQSLCDHHHKLKTTADAIRGKTRLR